ncbi:unnamed protein product [Agarophyton chilense]
MLSPKPQPEELEMLILPEPAVYGVQLSAPPSPNCKRLRAAESDASSSVKDIDEPDDFPPDSVPALVQQLHNLINYIALRPALHHASASFLRDSLRTLLLQNEKAAVDSLNAAAKLHRNAVAAGSASPQHFFTTLPDEITKHIFTFLDGKNLARCREVCSKWNSFASCEKQWKNLVTRQWRSLQSDVHAWKLIDSSVDPNGANRWRMIYPKASRIPKWRCRLQKTGRFMCNLVAHQIGGATIADCGLPEVLVVERRFNLQHLQAFVMADATVLYFEPESEEDRCGYEDFIEYLIKRTRAGLALDEQQRFIFIPPCEYTRNQVKYEGRSLLGVVQNAYPP